MINSFFSAGLFAKSNSFSSLNSKPKVKLVDQVVMQRQKSVKEHGSFRPKEGVVRSIGKSMSFRSTNSNRPESKIKMPSPRSSHIQDVKNTKERSAFERQRSFRAEHPSNNSMMGTSMNSTSRIDKRPSSRVESSSLTTTSNHHEVKQVHAEVKSAVLSRSSSLAARRTADLPSSTGRVRFQFCELVSNTSFLCFLLFLLLLHFFLYFHDQVTSRDHQNMAIVLLCFHQPMELIILNINIIRLA